MKVVSVNIGKKKIVKWNNKLIETGIYKKPVNTTIFLGKEDVKSDYVIDRRVHGGVDKAVYAYSQNHYEFWQKLYPKLEFNYGMFGENLTISNLDEEKIRVGSVYQLGEAKIEVTSPRQPCMKLGVKFGTQDVLKQFWNTTKSGIYFKVIETGFVSKSDTLILLDEAINNFTIAEVYKAKKIKRGK